MICRYSTNKVVYRIAFAFLIPSLPVYLLPLASLHPSVRRYALAELHDHDLLRSGFFYALTAKLRRKEQVATL